DDVAGEKGHDLGDEADEESRLEDHVARVAALLDLTVESRLNRDVVDIELGLDNRTEWGEGIETFGAHPLAVLALEVAVADVVAAGVTEHIVERLGLGDAR